MPQILGRPGAGTIDVIAQRRGLEPRRGKKPLRLPPQTQARWWYLTVSAMMAFLALCVIASVTMTGTVTGIGLLVIWAALISFGVYRVCNVGLGPRMASLPAALICVITCWLVPSGTATFLLAIIWIPTGAWLINVWRTTRRQVAVGRYPALERTWAKVAESGDISSGDFSAQEMPMVLGGLGEIYVAGRLNEGVADDATVIHGLEIRKVTGKTSADIDHLVLDRRGAVMVDAKVWGKDPGITAAPDGSGAMLHQSSPYAHTISTCLYEASQLPVAPAAILLTIAGSGLARSGIGFDDFPGGAIPITWAYPRYGELDAEPVGAAVYLVAAKDVAEHVENVLSSGRHTKLTLAALARTPQLVLP